MSKEIYQPKGFQFFDRNSKREMIWVEEGPYKDWICYKHPDGQWVTLRKATDADRSALNKGIVEAHHSFAYERDETGKDLD